MCIRDSRSGYTFNDDEKLTLMLFLNQEEPEVSQEVVKFALQVKQNAIWYDQAIVKVAQLILDKVTPTTISDRATQMCIRDRANAFIESKAFKLRLLLCDLLLW